MTNDDDDVSVEPEPEPEPPAVKRSSRPAHRLANQYLGASDSMRAFQKKVKSFETGLKTGKIIAANRKTAKIFEASLKTGKIIAANRKTAKVFETSRAFAAADSTLEVYANTSLIKFLATVSKISERYVPAPGWTEAIREATLPSANLREVNDLSLLDVADLAEYEGICLLDVPRSAIVEAIVHADDAAARRRVLRKHSGDIFDDCTAQLDMCVKAKLSGFVVAMRQAIGAAGAGLDMPAQALAASVIDSVLNLVYEKAIYEMVKWLDRSRDKQVKVRFTDLDLRSLLVFSALWRVYTGYWNHKGDAIPEGFTRHGSAHAVSPVQYTPANAVHAIMLCTSLLRFTNDLRPDEESWLLQPG